MRPPSRLLPSLILGGLSILASPASSQLANTLPADGVLGANDLVTRPPGGTTSSLLNGPNGVAIDPTTGKLFVTDRTNNRVLRWSSAAALVNGSAAEAVLGQTDFVSGGPNLGTNRFSSPIGISINASGALWVADFGNNRVLRFDDASSKPSGANADGVLGQPGFETNFAGNTANTMNSPVGVFHDPAGRLWVTLFNNHRVLRFDDAANKPNGANADGVLGQPDFVSQVQGLAANRMNSPNSVFLDAGGRLWVSDFNNRRVLRFDDAANKPNGANADGVLGQPDFVTNTPGLSQNRFDNTRFVSCDAFGRLYVVEENNNRVMIFNDAGTLPNGANADYVIGQVDFTSNAAPDPPSATSLATPRAITVESAVGRLWVADWANNRVLRYDVSLGSAPTLTLTSPNGGEDWLVGSQHSITWTAANVAQVRLEVSVDNGGAWQTIAEPVDATLQTYAWTVPNTPTAQALVRVTAVENGAVSDASNAVFTISAPVPTLTLTSPNGGEDWLVGSQHSITWTAANVAQVAIEYSIDDGGAWLPVTSPLSAAAGTYTWTVPNSPTNQGRVRVTAVENGAVSDASDGPFTIGNTPGSITLISPNGLQQWETGRQRRILFSSTGITDVRIEGSTDDGASWFDIMESTPAAGGSFTWSVPATFSTQWRIRLSDAENPAVSDVSADRFAIIPARSLGSFDRVFFSDSPTATFYEYSYGTASPPSTLERVNVEKLPVTPDYALYGNYALKVHWLSAAGGDWEAGNAGQGWTGRDVSFADSLIFNVFTETPTPQGALPSIYLEDVTNSKTPRVPLGNYLIGIPAGAWYRVAVPMQVFRDQPGSADLTEIKTVFLGQNGADGVDRTWLLDDFRTVGGAPVVGDSVLLIAVLGSSTSAGVGASAPESSWVGRYRNHLQSLDAEAVVVNLGVGGYSTYDVMPTGFEPPHGRPSPDVEHNITAALAYNPRAIIVNLPSNDVANGYSVAEQLANYDTLVARAGDIPVWITTSQPRDFSDPGLRLLLQVMTDSILTRYAPRAIDVWNGLANPDGTIPAQYGIGDGIHLNDLGHRFIFDRVVGAGVWELATTDVGDAPFPASLKLLQNAPNPFTRSTTIRFRLQAREDVSLRVYDVSGREVTTLVEGRLEPGEHSAVWRTEGNAAGLYFYCLRSGARLETRKMVLTR
jgi:sugar lactone lactonase YvrE/lysophospholipase L1-like esterase